MKKVICLWKRHGNFIFGKVYEARPRGVKVKTNMPVQFQIVDEDGDTFTVAKDLYSLEKGWKWVD